MPYSARGAWLIMNSEICCVGSANALTRWHVLPGLWLSENSRKSDETKSWEQSPAKLLNHVIPSQATAICHCTHDARHNHVGTAAAG